MDFQTFAVINSDSALQYAILYFLLVYLWDRFLEVGLMSKGINTHVILLGITKFPFSEFVLFCIPITAYILKSDVTVYLIFTIYQKLYILRAI